MRAATLGRAALRTSGARAPAVGLACWLRRSRPSIARRTGMSPGRASTSRWRSFCLRLQAQPGGARPGSRALRLRRPRSCSSTPGSTSSPLRRSLNSLSRSLKRCSSSCASPVSVGCVPVRRSAAGVYSFSTGRCRLACGSSSSNQRQSPSATRIDSALDACGARQCPGEPQLRAALRDRLHARGRKESSLPNIGSARVGRRARHAASRR